MKIQHAYKGNEQFCTQCNAPHHAHRGPRIKVKDAFSTTFVGIDGEGKTEHHGPWPGKHRYTLLCAADEFGRKYKIENPKGLRTKQCLDFILSIPHKDNTKLFSYSFGYDLTKILEDIDDPTLYKLVRPELRRRMQGKQEVIVPVYWPSANPQYCLNWINGRFTIKKIEGKHIVVDPNTGGPTVGYKWGQPTIIHDVWKFFQGKFTVALEDWKVPDDVSKDERKVVLDRMKEMKDQRSNFDQLDDEHIEEYCFDECKYMATLARKLTDAHIKAGIPLKNYFGAGSSAEAMMLVMNIKEHVKKARADNPTPEDVEYVQRCAFFGGRFELGRIGPIRDIVFGQDISSAYVYQLAFLPCLIHGRWEHTTDRQAIHHARTAIVRYTLNEPIVKRPWAPFPFRMSNGSIAFPESSGGGWVWREEYFAGEKLFDNVCFQEAWLYHCDCDCQPFKDIPKYYTLRIQIGKEGPGIVIKLGMNSNYGKTAQTIGGKPGTFHSWMWAGLITSGCRAQVLEAMAAHRDLDNLLMVATDGIATLEKITLPKPLDTGTNWLICPEPDPKDVAESPELFKRQGNQWLVNKPLGGWEEKAVPNGMFLARPGIYFPMNPTDKDIKRIRARGLGRAAVWNNWKAIIEAYENGQPGIQIQNLSLFRGIKTSITRSGKPGAFTYKRSDNYGRWISRPIDMTFSPLPKREAKIGEGGRLTLRKLDGLESLPYDKGILSPEALILLQQSIEESEQPDGGDLTDCDAWEE
ncbi:Uncharacterised protein [uncultured archaeon]|nr:Uncharacterised protein [uncultured archaeon]